MILYPAAVLLDLSNNLDINLVVADSLHHSEMLEVIMCLEKSVSSEKFN
jgi:hypothetical protein